MKHLLIGAVVALVLGSGCAQKVPPPDLTQPGITAWENMRYQGYMDSARDLSITVAAVPVTVAKPIVVWHRSAITTLHSRSEGWKQTILTGLDEVSRNIPPTQDKLLLALTAVRTVLSIVLREVPTTDAAMIAAYEAAYAASLQRDTDWLAAH